MVTVVNPLFKVAFVEVSANQQWNSATEGVEEHPFAFEDLVIADDTFLVAFQLPSFPFAITKEVDPSFVLVVICLLLPSIEVATRDSSSWIVGLHMVIVKLIEAVVA